MQTFLKDLLSVGSSKVKVIIFGLGYSIITARYLGPSLNGTLASLIVYPTLFMTLGSLGIRQSTAYFVGRGEFDELAIKRAVVFLWYISSIICLIASYFLVISISKSGGDQMMIFLAIMPIPFTLFNTYSSGVFLGKNEIVEFNKIDWLPALFKVLATLLLVVVLSYSIYGALFAAVISPAVMSIMLAKRGGLVKGFSFNVDFRVVRALFKLGIIYAIALIVINLNYKIDIILLDRLSTPYETGIYSKGSQLMEYLWQIPMLLSTIIFARSAVAKNGFEFSKKVTVLLRISLIVVGLGALVLLIFSKLIITLLFGSEFAPSATVQQILLPGVVLLTIYKVLNMDLAGKGKPWIAMISMIPALIVNVVLNLIWIPSYGANGAAFASTISYTLAAVVFIFVYSRTILIPVLSIITYRKSDFDVFKKLAKRFTKI
jgi:O-antigen/teichoic acid export membrane protein